MTLVLWSLAILTGGCAWSLLLARAPRAALLGGLGAIALASITAVVAAAQVLAGPSAEPWAFDWPLPLGTATLALDGLSAWFLLAIGLVSAAVAVYSWGYLRDDCGRRPAWLFAALLCVLVGALELVVCAADTVLFLFGWELMGLSAFFLIGFQDRDGAARWGAWLYLIATHMGTGLGVVPAFAILFALSGTTSFAGLGPAVAAGGPAACVTLFALGLIGFGTKAGLMPMHVWLPVAHPVAPSPVSALLSAVVIKTGVYGLLRLLTWLPPLPRTCALVMICVGLLSAVMGILYALAQRDLKTSLAFSSVENVGIIGLGIGVGMLGDALAQPTIAALGYAGALLHVLNHALMKGLLFLSAGAVLHGAGTADIERLGGLARRTPVNAALFLVGVVAICALPPVNGFLSEFLIYLSLGRGVTVLPVVYASVAAAALALLALVGGLAVAAFSRLFGVVFLGEPRDDSIRPHPTPHTMRVGMIALAAACVAIGLAGPWLVSPLGNVLAALRPAALPPAALEESLASLGGVSAATACFVLLVGALVAARVVIARRTPTAAQQPTWGCGYARPTAQMQYTGASYAFSLVFSFHALLHTQRKSRPPRDAFPEAASLETHTPDAALTRIYRPLFAAIRRAFERVWPLQRGRIQLYLVYIIAALILFFLIEAWLGPGPASSRAAAIGSGG